MNTHVSRIVKPLVSAIVLAGLLLPQCLWMAPSEAVAVRIKDLTHIQGVRENQLLGYGIVVGLHGTGDKSRSTQRGQQSLLLNFGNVVENPTDVKIDNSAAVLVTANIPAFAKPGDKIDITVSAMNDAKSLEGGVLIQTQMLAANGEVVALAQGPVSVGGVSVSAAGSSKRTAITTSGRVPNGAIVEREIQTDIGDETGYNLVLNHADFTMASTIAQVITDKVAPAFAMDAATVRIEFPGSFAGNRIPFISTIENVMVDSSPNVARVVINERTGTIVIGNAVRLQPAAVAHGGITVSIKAENSASQPNQFSNGTTLGVTNANIDIEEKQGSLIQLSANQSLQDLVTALNTLGVTPNDLISILQALKAAGSLEAELEII